jgi:hypothetical protein
MSIQIQMGLQNSTRTFKIQVDCHRSKPKLRSQGAQLETCVGEMALVDGRDKASVGNDHGG